MKIGKVVATILIIEDRPVNLRFVATLLRDRGYRLLEARGGEEALRIVRAERPDLVIIDILTSGMDGCQFVLNLRSEPNSVQPRIVFRAAAHIAAEAEALATTFGASFIAKPVNPETLLAVFEAALSGPSALPVEADSRDKSIDSFLRPIARKLGREESRARRSGLPFGVMMIDIDNFKRFNDTLGHAAGDAVLRAIGQYMLSAARGEDIVSRYGGEEFVLVMAPGAQGTVSERAEKLRRGVQDLEIEYEGRRVGPITISVGIAIFPDHGENGQEVLRASDAALYQAKRSGRNCVVVGDKVKA